MAARVLTTSLLGAAILTLAAVDPRVAGAADAPSQHHRPRVGLVLGGGGARGFAHFGVLRTLEELRIPIDCIAGTSMGALVGGVYAAGVPVDEMINRVGHIDWDALFDDDPPRDEIPFHVKRDDAANLFHFELGERDGSLLVASGSTAGYKFEFLLREMVARSGNFADQDFNQLPIPFRAMATNIEQGTLKVFDHGDLVKAMRASMSVPGAIAPVEIDGVLYVDGGLLQNIPIAAARQTCADVVIAVDVGSGLLPRSSLNSALGVSLQMINVMMAQNVRSSIDSLHPDDVLIQPQLEQFSAANFAQATSLIPIGEAAAREQLDRLRRLSVSEQEYAAWRAAVTAREPVVPPVTDVRVATTDGWVNPKVLEAEIASVPGIDLRRKPETDFSLDNLNRRLEQVYGRGDFERMDYAMIDSPGSRVVELKGVEKSWGPNYVKFGLSLASDDENTRFNAAASYRQTWLNSFGAEWRNDLQLGYHDLFSSEFYQPVLPDSSAFVAPRIELSEKPVVYYIDSRRYGQYDVRYARAHFDFGVQSKWGELRAGLFAGHLEAKEDFGFIHLPNDSLKQVGYTFSAIFDQMNNPTFARDGVLAMLRTIGTAESLGSDEDYNKTDVLLMGAKTFDRHALQFAAYTGFSLTDKVPSYDPFLLGGFLRGSGYRMDELLGDKVALVRGVYTYKLTSLPHPLGSGFYVGGSLEATRGTVGLDPNSEKKIRPSASIFLAADTIIGPAYLAFGHAFDADGENALYLLLGRP